MHRTLLSGLLTLLIVLSVIPASMAAPSQQAQNTNGGETFKVAGAGQIDNLAELVKIYNNNTKQVPGLIVALVGGERINLHITAQEETVIYGFVLKGAKIKDYQEGGIEDPTLEVFTSMETIDAIRTAENPQKRAVRALNSDEITYRTTGIVNRIKFGVMTAMMKIFG